METAEYADGCVVTMPTRALEFGYPPRTRSVEDKREFFKAAFKSITLDVYGRGLWRQRSVKAYELSDPLNTFILQHASA
jgi:hypothetical protein